MISILLCILFIGESLYSAHSAGTLAANPPELYGIASKSVYARRIKKAGANLYVGGHSDGAVGSDSIGGFDLFIRKYPTGESATDTPLWTKMFGTSGEDKLGDFAVDASGNMYAVGMCSGTVNGVATKGSGDACIFKLDSSGSILCSAQYGGTGVDRFNGVALDETNGYFFAVGNTTSATFDGTSTVGKAAGFFYRFKMSDCAQAGNKYVQSMPQSTGTMHFGGVAVQSTGVPVVAFVFTITSATYSHYPSIAGLNYNGNVNAGTFGFLKVDCSSGTATPFAVATIILNQGGQEVESYVNGMAIDANDNVFMAAEITSSTDGIGFSYKVDKNLRSSALGFTSAATYTQALGVEVDSDLGVVYYSFSSNHATPGTPYTFQGVTYTAPITFIRAFSYPGFSLIEEATMVHADGATQDMTVLDGVGSYLAVGRAHGDFEGLTGPGVVNMYTYKYNFTFAPTAMPTLTPTQIPTLVPSAEPSVSPSVGPTLMPSSGPSPAPSVSPSAGPTLTPSAGPTADPTMPPTSEPTRIPTAAPTVSPTTRPTDGTVRNLVLEVSQTVHNLDVATYNAQKADFNVTFQSTIAATLDGITPQGVANIKVTQKTAAGRVRSNAGGAVSQCALDYTLTMYDTQVEFAVFRAQLVEAVSAGTMDAHFRHYAGMHGIDNSSYFGDAQAKLPGGGSSDRMGGVEIAAVVIGVLMGILLICVLVGFFYKRDKNDESYHQPQQRQAPATSEEVVGV